MLILMRAQNLLKINIITLLTAELSSLDFQEIVKIQIFYAIESIVLIRFLSNLHSMLILMRAQNFLEEVHNYLPLILRKFGLIQLVYFQIQHIYLCNKIHIFHQIILKIAQYVDIDRSSKAMKNEQHWTIKSRNIAYSILEKLLKSACLHDKIHIFDLILFQLLWIKCKLNLKSIIKCNIHKLKQEK